MQDGGRHRENLSSAADIVKIERSLRNFSSGCRKVTSAKIGIDQLIVKIQDGGSRHLDKSEISFLQPQYLVNLCEVLSVNAKWAAPFENVIIYSIFENS